MEDYTISKEMMTNMIMDKAIAVLEEALKSSENAFAFRNGITKTYLAELEDREKLFRQFYFSFKKYYGKNIDEKKLTDADDFFYHLDCEISESIKKYVPKEKNQYYMDLQIKLWDWFSENDKEDYDYEKNIDYQYIYEVLLNESIHNDLFYLIGIRFYGPDAGS